MSEWVSIWAAFLSFPFPCDPPSKHCVRKESVKQHPVEYQLCVNCAVLEWLDGLLHLI